MSIDDLREFACSLPEATEDLKWGHDLCFLIGEKIFLVLGPDAVPVSGSFKTTEERFDELCSRAGFTPAPYMARHKWVQVQDCSTLPRSEWEEHVRLSYGLVSAKLPKKIRVALGLV